MPASISMPKLGMTMEEGTVAHWLEQEGGTVQKDSPILEIETEKIVFQVESPAAGILHIVVPEGTVIPCGGTCGVVAANEAEYRSLVGGAPTAEPAMQSTSKPMAADGSAPGTLLVDSGERVISSPAARRLAADLGVDFSLIKGSGPGGRIIEDDVKQFVEARKSAAAMEPAPAAEPERIMISPIARKLAEEHGVNLSGIQGSGPGGRILREDVLAAIDRQTAPVPASPPLIPEAPAVISDRRRIAKTISLVGMRKAIADHMTSSLQSAAQLTVAVDVDATELVRLRQQLVSEAESIGARISYNDLIARAIIKALKESSIFNSRVEGGEINVFDNVNLGLAVNLDDGLIVPVLHNADQLSVVELSKASTALVDKARNHSLGLDDVTDGTFTITNLGAVDIVVFTPIINAPESAILGVGGIAERPAVVNGQLAVRSQMSLSLTWDHRVADGVPAVQFIQDIKRLLEKPSVLLI